MQHLRGDTIFSPCTTTCNPGTRHATTSKCEQSTWQHGSTAIACNKCKPWWWHSRLSRSTIWTLHRHVFNVYVLLQQARPTIHIKQENPVDTLKSEAGTKEAQANNCFFIVCTKEEGTTYSDLCGRYPVKSSRGNQYIMVCYDYDSNAILAEQIQTKHHKRTTKNAWYFNNC